MHNMKRQINYISIIFFLLAILAGCNDDEFVFDEGINTADPDSIDDNTTEASMIIRQIVRRSMTGLSILASLVIRTLKLQIPTMPVNGGTTMCMTHR